MEKRFEHFIFEIGQTRSAVLRVGLQTIPERTMEQNTRRGYPRGQELRSARGCRHRSAHGGATSLRTPGYKPSSGRNLAVTSASKSADALVANCARRAAQSALFTWSARTTPDTGESFGRVTSNG
jgi:hypothetical protein